MQIDSTDRNLWIAIKESDHEALTELFRRYYFYLVKLGINYTIDSELAKDAANEIFFNIWRNRKTLSDVDNIKAYLTTSYRNYIFMVAKRNLKNVEQLKKWQTEQKEGLCSYEEMLIMQETTEERKKILQQALEQLSPRQKEYLKLKFYERLSYEQMAAETGQTVKTIYNTIYEAIKILRQHLVKKIN